MKEEFILKFYEDRSIRVEFKEDKDMMNFSIA